MQKLSLEINPNVQCVVLQQQFNWKEYEDKENKGMVHDLLIEHSKYMHGMKIKVLGKIAKQMNDMTLIKFSWEPNSKFILQI